jgi:uncharacterized phage-associated protein
MNMASKSFPFNEEKALNAVLYIAKSLTRPDFHKIFKILYFADRTYIAEYGMPITGDKYIAMKAGPVPSRIYDIFKSVRGDANVFLNSDYNDLFSVDNNDIIKTKKEANLRKISPNEKNVIDKCIEENKDLEFKEITKKSHDIAWKGTKNNREIELHDIALEAGLDDEEYKHVEKLMELKNILC